MMYPVRVETPSKESIKHAFLAEGGTQAAIWHPEGWQP